MMKNNSQFKAADTLLQPAAAMRSGWIQPIIVLLVIALGGLGTYLLITMRKPPERKEIEKVTPLVEVEQVHKSDIRMIVRGYGTVSPKVQVDIIPEVSGKIVYVHPQMKAGGMISAEEKLFQIDPRDYELAVEQANAAVAEAQVRLDTEAAEALVARKEWTELHPDTEPNSPLVLREPQIRRAKSALDSANAQLSIAKLKLERTSVSLPFDALIISEKVDQGQYVVMGQPLGAAHGIETVEIEVPLEDDELAWFDVFDKPNASRAGKPATQQTQAEVRAWFAGAEHSWPGRVVRTTGQVDRTSRMVSIVVEVDNPFDPSGKKPPLLSGAFAEVIIKGKTLKDAIAVPRDAIRQGKNVWVLNDGHLKIRTLNIVRADKKFAYTTTGIEDGAAIILSSLDAVVEGMAVRPRTRQTGTDAGISHDANEPIATETD
ncbi:MAG: efflux RND transporter periplasmic adaptor subunit [Sedimentisphaerales bacterium]|nr:efflux RND transporter periplasmic adaptor subunit [Sedimentisphaerales bacterium]